MNTFTADDLQGLVLNPLNERDYTAYDVFLDGKNGLLNLSFAVKENRSVQNLIQSLVKIDHELKTLTVTVNNPIQVFEVTEQNLAEIVQDLGNDCGLIPGQTVVLTGNSRVYIIRSIIAELTADLGYSLVIDPVRYESKTETFKPLDLITAQTIDNTGVPQTARQSAANIERLIAYHEPKIEGKNQKEIAGKLNAILVKESGLAIATVMALKKFLTLPDVLRSMVDQNRMAVENAIKIQTICNSKDMKSIDMDVQSFLRLCLVRTGDADNGTVTERHIKAVKEELDQDNDFGKEETVAVDPSGEAGDETSEVDDKPKSAKALEGQRLRELATEQLNAENSEKMANAVDLIAEYQAELYDTDDKIKHNLLISDLISLLKSSKTVAQKAFEKAQQAEVRQQEQAQTIPVEVVAEVANALVDLV